MKAHSGNKESAPVNRILPFSMVDGKGNRSVIFLQKCNISCIYCHNPETQKMCMHCGVCLEGCPTKALARKEDKVVWDEKKCIQCDQCIKVCPNYASPRIKWMTAKQVYTEVKKNIPFIRGITVSGGECTLYPEFLVELFLLAKKDHLSCFLDSNGTIDFSHYPELVSLCDGILLDVKAWKAQVFYNLTGGDNTIVKNNLEYLVKTNKLEEIRIVCLPEEVDIEDTLHGIVKTIGKKTCYVTLKLIKFRPFGVKGKFGNKQSPDDKWMEEFKKIAVKLGFGKIRIT